jgi:hypothetical protein
MFVDVAAYHGFCLLAFGVCIGAIVPSGDLKIYDISAYVGV